MDVSNPSVRTLDDLIRYGKTSAYSQPSISLFHKEDDIVYLANFAYDKYEKLIRKYSAVLTLDDEQMSLYRYRPDLLSNQIYGTPNLTHLILYLNNCAEHDFISNRVWLMAPSYVNTIFQSIINHEQANIKKSLSNTIG